jgi:hypothetical protein
LVLASVAVSACTKSAIAAVRTATVGRMLESDPLPVGTLGIACACVTRTGTFVGKLSDATGRLMVFAFVDMFVLPMVRGCVVRSRAVGLPFTSSLFRVRDLLPRVVDLRP